MANLFKQVHFQAKKNLMRSIGALLILSRVHLSSGRIMDRPIQDTPTVCLLPIRFIILTILSFIPIFITQHIQPFLVTPTHILPMGMQEKTPTTVVVQATATMSPGQVSAQNRILRLLRLFRLLRLLNPPLGRQNVWNVTTLSTHRLDVKILYCFEGIHPWCHSPNLGHWTLT